MNWFPARTRPHGVTVVFRWRHARYPGVLFNVTDGCAEAGATMKRFRFGRLIVRWSTTYVDAQAWSCVTPSHRKIMFHVSAPGYGLRGSPSPRDLALMIGAAQHVLR